MRKIQFRGLYRGIMVYGNLIQGTGLNGEKITQIERSDANDFAKYDVDPETVGQFIPSIGHNNIECYEGDIIEYQMNKHGKPVGMTLTAYIKFNEYTSSWQLCYWATGEFWATMDIKG